MEIINGKAIAQRIREEIKNKIRKINGRRPGLAIVLVGNRSDSEIYVKLKEKAAKEVGVKTYLYKFSQNAKQEDIIEIIKQSNLNDKIDAILIQLPLPNNLDTDKIMDMLDPKKDADGFQPKNLKILMNTCQHEEVIPPIFKVVLEILKETRCSILKKTALIISNSDIFGKSLEKVLRCKGVLAKKIDPNDDILTEDLLKADIVISAVGRPEFIKGDILKENAVVIDIGITKRGRNIYGDIDAESVKNKKGFITPVPGGVGPITVAMLLKNTLKLYERRRTEN